MTIDEKYKQAREELQRENIEQFPSLFQQARNVLKQAWLSASDTVVHGRPFLSTPEKAKARLDICSTCEFLKEDRCLKCGCFMDKKVHIESAQCPVNKWGPELQKMFDEQELIRRNRPGLPPIMPIDLNKMTPEKRQQMLELAEPALQYDGKFMFEGKQYIARRKTENSPIALFEVTPKDKARKGFIEQLTEEEKVQFNQLIKQQQDNQETKTFSFKEKTFNIVPYTTELGVTNFRVVEIHPENTNTTGLGTALPVQE